MHPEAGLGRPRDQGDDQESHRTAVQDGLHVEFVRYGYQNMRLGVRIYMPRRWRKYYYQRGYENWELVYSTRSNQGTGFRVNSKDGLDLMQGWNYLETIRHTWVEDLGGYIA